MNVQLNSITCKKTAIFDSTLCLIKEHGFHGTPMSMIAKNANVAAGTIYHYFESKDALIKALYIYVKDGLADAIPSDDNLLSYKELFIQYWVDQCAYFIAHENALYFLEQYNTSPYRISNPEIESKVFLTRIVPFFQKGIDSGQIRKMDYQLLMPVIHGSIVATAKYHLLGHYDFTKERLQETALIIWDGIKMQQSTITTHPII
ncbi:TetR/AcrR family transcriptional regulator [Arcticibacter eurypsychrophilus]|uniref:TetR/AcrR family transcriptional regulator n=1 Tax=Arcticibacter eurypsychrophilus TaxID=1434752 RepID=UPI00084DF7F8|nr:TetR/AcrR family transcriptional regulator [Arcticibacter eurypsychrophilus]